MLNLYTYAWPLGKLLLKSGICPGFTASVTIWVMLPVFCQHTDCPTAIETEDGVKAKLSPALTVAAAPLGAHRLTEPVESPQATLPVRAKKAQSARLVRIGRTSGRRSATNSFITILRQKERAT